MPLISVIVPVYKVGLYLRRCVDSILAQTFTDFELILVDDGSPDNCGKICDEYAQKDKRIHVIHQTNGGLSAARNAGIDWAFANSDSEWISFIDSDDWVHPCFMEFLIRAVQEAKTKVSACLLKRVECETPMEQAEFTCESLAWDAFYMRSWANGAVAYNKLYKKELFRERRYPVGRINEDEFLTYKLLAQAGLVAAVDTELYFYFQNPEGIMKREFTLAKLDGVKALAEQCRFAKKHGYTSFYMNRMQARLGRLAQYHAEAKESKSLTRAEKRRADRFLRSEMRKVLLAEGKELAPIKEKRWYYEEAFPFLNWAHWTIIGIIGRIKRLVKK